MDLQFEKFRVGPLDNNIYLLRDRASDEALIIDPSVESEAALQTMRDWQREGTQLKAIWNTHGHFDHIYDNELWKGEWNVPLGMHRADQGWLEKLPDVSLWFNFAPRHAVAPDFWIDETTELKLGNHRAKVLCVPGHSQGSIAFWFEEAGLCFSGDVLFYDAVGRTDLPGCSVSDLNQSLLKLAALPLETQILAGHGKPTTVARERQHNPFLQALLPADEVVNAQEIETR